MISNLKRFLTSLLKSNGWVSGVVIIAGIFITLIVWRCERQRSINSEVKYELLELKNKSLESDIEVLNNKNILLYEKIDSIHFVIDTLDKSGLKDMFAKYKSRYYLHPHR